MQKKTLLAGAATLMIAGLQVDASTRGDFELSQFKRASPVARYDEEDEYGLQTPAVVVPIVTEIVKQVAIGVITDYTYDALKQGTQWVVNQFHDDEEEEQQVQHVVGTIIRDVAVGVIGSYVKEGLDNGVAWIKDKNENGWFEEDEEISRGCSTRFTKVFVSKVCDELETPVKQLDKKIWSPQLFAAIHKQGQKLTEHLHPLQPNKEIILANLAKKYAKGVVDALYTNKLNDKNKVNFSKFGQKLSQNTFHDEDEVDFSKFGQAFDSFRNWQASTLGASLSFDEDELLPVEPRRPIHPLDDKWLINKNRFQKHRRNFD